MGMGTTDHREPSRSCPTLGMELFAGVNGEPRLPRWSATARGPLSRLLHKRLNPQPPNIHARPDRLKLPTPIDTFPDE